LRRPPIDRRALGRSAAWGLAIAAVVQPSASLAAWIDWRADLISHLREPALGASLIASAAMVRVRRWVALGLLVLALVQGWGLARTGWPNPTRPDPGSTARLRILMANVLVDNPDHDDLIRLIRRERPDVVGLVEVSRAWLAALGPIWAEYPARCELPDDDEGRGLALWFRSPPASAEVVRPLAPGGNPAIHARVDFAGEVRDLWLVHNVSPLDRPGAMPLGAELAGLAARVRRDGGSTVVVGDLNCTDGSPFFGRFLRDSGLRDSRIGFGRQASWPAWSPYRIAIDHAFLSPDLAVDRRRIGPGIGSDHFPLILDLAPAAPAASPSAKDAAHASQPSTPPGS